VPLRDGMSTQYTACYDHLSACMVSTVKKALGGTGWGALMMMATRGVLTDL
jgi:hypothetical protein